MTSAEPLIALDPPAVTAGDIPLVLLHPFPYDARCYGDVRAQLAPDIPVLALDGPGWGASALPDISAGAPSLEYYADAVAATLAGAGARRAVLAGISMGGYVALAFAERHGSMLAGLALIDTKAEADPPEGKATRRQQAAAAEERGGQVVADSYRDVLGRTSLDARPEVVDQCRQWLSQADGDAISWAQLAMAARPARHQTLTRITCPVLVVRGFEDEVSSADSADAMATSAELAGVEVTQLEIPEVGHLPMVESPKTLARALEQFYRQAVSQG